MLAIIIKGRTVDYVINLIMECNMVKPFAVKEQEGVWPYRIKEADRITYFAELDVALLYGESHEVPVEVRAHYAPSLWVGIGDIDMTQDELDARSKANNGTA